MRRGPLIFLLIALLIFSFAIRSVWTLLSLLVEDAAIDAIDHAELRSPNATLIETRPQIIPKIIHQTYKNETIPQVWVEAQQSCIDLHPDYEYMLWTDENSREFIAAEYPWFLETFDGYEYPIQRADSIRYFVLAFYGGTYIDLDDGCNRRLDLLLTYPAWVRRTVPTGISNDAMGSIPQHPFFLHVIKTLQQYERHWLLPYITIMYSTGPLFLSVIWKEYMQDHPSESNRVRVLMQGDYMKNSWSFFLHHTGNSWHGNDAHLIFWMGRHWMFLTFCGLLLVTVVGFCCIWTYSRVTLPETQYHYTKVPPLKSPSRLSSSPTRCARRVMFTLLQRVNVKEDEESGGATETSYDLGFRSD